jgi:hypothetical protein
MHETIGNHQLCGSVKEFAGIVEDPFGGLIIGETLNSFIP